MKLLFFLVTWYTSHLVTRLGNCVKIVQLVKWPVPIFFFFSRMHLALKAYQELLLTINEMDQSKDESIRQSSVVIKSRMQFWCLTNFHLLSFSCRFHSFSFSVLLLYFNSTQLCLLWFSRQHILPDGIQGDFSNPAEEVWWNTTASFLPQRPGRVNTSLPANAGTVL